MIELEIENFGPIRRIEGPGNRIRINDLTLFIGPSNTGKSLLMKLLYAITDSINDAVKDHITSPFLASSPQVRNYILDILTNLDIENIQEVLIDKDKLENFLYNYLNEILKDVEREAETRIRRIFYPEIIKGKVKIIIDNFLIVEYENGNVSAKIDQEKMKEVRDKLRNTIENINVEIKEEGNGKTVEISYRKDLLDIHISERSRSRNVNLMYIDVLRRITSIVLREILSEEILRMCKYVGPLYLPAGRSLILERLDSLLPLRLARIYESEDGGDPVLDKMLWLIIRSLETCSIIEKYDLLRENQGGKDILIELITRVIQGNIEVVYNREAKRYEVYINLRDRKIPIKNTSASIREILPILLLKLSGLLNDIYALFIEEPETELHPEKQIEIARILTVLAQEYLKVIASTHSDLILQELAILAKAYSLKREDRVKIIGEDVYIDPNKLSVYVFTREGVILDWSENVRDIVKMGEIPYISDILQKQLITILKITRQNSEYASART